MAKPKIDFKKLLLEKGEKYALVACGVLMALLIVWGISAATGSVDTEGKAKELVTGASGIKTKIATGPAGDVPPLEPWVTEPVTFGQIAAADHMNSAYFIDFDHDTRKRGTPTIYGPTEFQVDVIRDPIFCYGFTKIVKNNQEVIDKIYVLGADVKKGENQKIEFADRFKGKKAQNRPNRQGPGGGLAGGGPGMGGPGMGGPGMGGPGMGGPGMGGPGMGGPGMGGPGMGGPGMGGMGGRGMGMGMGMGGPGMGGVGGVGSGSNFASEVVRQLVLVPVDEFLKNNGKYTPAQFVRPMRAVVVTASFPWRQQLTEYQKQLRYDSLSDLMGNNADQPQFKGFDVKRRITAPDGRVGAWEDFDWLEKYDPIFTEKIVEDYQDPPELAPVIPPEDTNLFLPLPKLVRGEYPKIGEGGRMPSIERTLAAIKNSKDANLIQPGGENKLGGGGNPFAHGGAGKKKPTDSKPADGPGTKPQVAQEAFLIRFIDVDVRPGFGYEYQVSVRVANPNYGKKDKVSTPKQAEDKELESAPVTVTFKSGGNDKATVARISEERMAYVAIPEKYENVKPDQVRLQIHEWMESVRLDRSNSKSSEPIGDWIVEDVAIPRGQFVIGTKHVKVPIWSPTKNAFVYMEFGKGKAGSPASKEKGTLPVDLGAPLLLVDFDGGRFGGNVARGRYVSDEGGTEVLLLGEDGKLRARAAWIDVADAERAERERAWLAWQKETKEAGADKPKDNAFDKGPSK
jgi:hypothetical protein